MCYQFRVCVCVCMCGEGGVVSLHLHPNLQMGSMETTDGVKLTLYICI